MRTNVADGTFGAWDETGRYTQLALLTGALDGMGYGESLGRFICEGGCYLPEATRLQRELEAWVRQPDGDETAPARAELLRAMSGFGWTGGWQDIPHPHATESLTAAAWHQRVPLTVHPGIGYDIVFVHPTARGAVLGRAAGIDFGVFAQAVSGLQGGVLLSVGSAVMALQDFEKAASVANNLRLQQGQGVITPFVAVNDLAPVDWDWSKGEPRRDSPAYYLRFCKSSTASRRKWSTPLATTAPSSPATGNACDRTLGSGGLDQPRVQRHHFLRHHLAQTARQRAVLFRQASWQNENAHWALMPRQSGDIRLDQQLFADAGVQRFEAAQRLTVVVGCCRQTR